MLSFEFLLWPASDYPPLWNGPGKAGSARPPRGMKLAIIRERMLCLLFLCETMFTIGESRTISYPNDTEVQAQQVPANSRRERFSIDTPRENAD